MKANKKLTQNRTRLVFGLSIGLVILPAKLRAAEEKVAHAVDIEMAVNQYEIIPAETLLSESNNKQLKEYGTPDLIAAELAALAQEQNPAYQKLVTYYKEKSYPAVVITGARAHGPFAPWNKEKDPAYCRLQTRVMPLLVSHIVKKKVQLLEEDAQALKAERKKEKEFWSKWVLPMGILSGLELIAFIGSLIYIGVHPDTCGSK